MAKIAVVIPSRLQFNPASPVGRLYLHRAVASVIRQTVAKDHEIKIVVGVDDDGRDLKADLPTGIDIAVGGHSQAAAVNAAAQMALGWSPELLAFLEDDDTWHHSKLEYQLAALADGYDFVSASAREIKEDGDYVRINDWAGPSGWLMPTQTWLDVGPFDETFKWHVDTQWIGMLNATGKRRLHFAEAGADIAHVDENGKRGPRPWLNNVGQFSKVAMTDGLGEPLVNRTINERGGMWKIAHDPTAAAESHNEHQRMWQTLGARLPW